MAHRTVEHSVMYEAVVGDGDQTAIVAEKVTETTDLMRNEQPSMAMVPASAGPSTTLSTSHAATSANLPMATTSAMHVQTGIPEAEEPWPFVTKALMVAVISIQPPATAASTLLDVFRPLVEGSGAARKESKRWKERAEAYLAEHHKYKAELGHKHDALHAHSQTLQRSLAESEARVRELESEHSTLRSSVSSLEKKLAEAEATKQAVALEVQQRKKEVEAMAKSAREAKAAYDRQRQEADNRAKAQTAEINKLLDKMKENDGIKVKLEEQIRSTMAKNASYEEQLAQKTQEATTLQSRVADLNARKEALERQVAIYQRLPTRRF